MKVFKLIARRMLLLAVPVLVSITIAACGSKEAKEAQTAAKDHPTQDQQSQQTQSQPQTVYGRAVAAAKTNVAALSNPKVGFDPVCGMAIDESAIIVTIDGKDYGVCSESCAKKLREHPEKYLVASADSDENP